MFPVTCDDANVLFDVLDYEADDHDETWFVFEMFASTVGAWVPGVRVQHATARSTCHVVPVVAKPYTDGGFVCPTCHILHPVKSVHLWLDDRGECLVSEGVLGELRLAGMPGLTVVGSVEDPPPLRIVQGVSREQIDQENRKVHVWKETQSG